jgi:hypothetical protein
VLCASDGNNGVVFRCLLLPLLMFFLCIVFLSGLRLDVNPSNPQLRFPFAGMCSTPASVVVVSVFHKEYVMFLFEEVSMLWTITNGRVCEEALLLVAVRARVFVTFLLLLPGGDFLLLLLGNCNVVVDEVRRRLPPKEVLPQEAYDGGCLVGGEGRGIVLFLRRHGGYDLCIDCCHRQQRWWWRR